MKTIKKIVLGRPFSPKEMGLLNGGANVNEAIWCTCNGNNDSEKGCSNNTNTSFGCTCYGTSTDNTNTNWICNCGEE